MTSVVIIICIPTEKCELELQNKGKAKLKRPFSEVHLSKKAFTLPAASSSAERISRSECDYKGSPACDNVQDDYKSMEKQLKNIFQDLNIVNSVWCGKDQSNYVQVTFSLESSDRCEEVLAVLKEHNIGKLYNSTVSVVPCTVHYGGDGGEKDLRFEIEVEPEEKTTTWNKFVSSVRARLTVAEVVENVRSRATFTFDFFCLILISTILCAIGMVENSNMYLLSSMLISPMMGPVMAGTFGSVIQDKGLQKMGVHNELMGLGLATVVGFCYGSIICLTTDKYGEHDWPTYEMTSRGELRSLWVGCLIALLSGAAVALGILSDNIASLVGVAISTSLMPPAVNAGLLWSLASIYYITQDEATRYKSLTHTGFYSENELKELLTLGAVNVCLTFVNIICIYVAGIVVFKIKEVAPISSKYYSRKQFWRHDIKIARDYNKTIQNEGEFSNLYRTIPEEIDMFRRENDMYSKHFHDFLHHSTDLSKENAKHSIRRSQYTWSPCMDANKSPHIKELKDMLCNLGSKTSGTPRVLNFDVFGQRKSQHTKLSQIFPLSPRKDEVQVPSVRTPLLAHAKSKKGHRRQRSSGKKFIVTPCPDDPA